MDVAAETARAVAAAIAKTAADEAVATAANAQAALQKAEQTLLETIKGKAIGQVRNSDGVYSVQLDTFTAEERGFLKDQKNWSRVQDTLGKSHAVQSNFVAALLEHLQEAPIAPVDEGGSIDLDIAPPPIDALAECCGHLASVQAALHEKLAAEKRFVDALLRRAVTETLQPAIEDGRILGGFTVEELELLNSAFHRERAVAEISMLLERRHLAVESGLDARAANDPPPQAADIVCGEEGRPNTDRSVSSEVGHGSTEVHRPGGDAPLSRAAPAAPTSPPGAPVTSVPAVPSQEAWEDAIELVEAMRCDVVRDSATGRYEVRDCPEGAASIIFAAEYTAATQGKLEEIFTAEVEATLRVLQQSVAKDGEIVFVDGAPDFSRFDEHAQYYLEKHCIEPRIAEQLRGIRTSEDPPSGVSLNDLSDAMKGRGGRG